MFNSTVVSQVETKESDLPWPPLEAALSILNSSLILDAFLSRK